MEGDDRVGAAMSGLHRAEAEGVGKGRGEAWKVEMQHLMIGKKEEEEEAVMPPVSFS